MIIIVGSLGGGLVIDSFSDVEEILGGGASGNSPASLSLAYTISSVGNRVKVSSSERVKFSRSSSSEGVYS